jgi:membrane protease YdiL (CAAX protease family)
MTLSDSQQSSSRSALSPLIVSVWFVTLLVSTLPDAIWNQFVGPTPPWLFWGKAGLLTVLIILAWAWKRTQPLRSYFILLFMNILAWWLLPWIRISPSWSRWEGEASWVVGILGIQLLKIGMAVLTIVALLFVMRRRQNAFLVKGQLGAKAEPIRWLGLKDPASWKIFGPIVAVIAAAIMLVVLVVTHQPSTTTLVRALPLLPAALLFSATNAFSEEVSYRASLLAPLHRVVGKGHAMALTAVFFGLAHYAGGVPLATLPTILMTAFLGLFMAKSMLETKGFFWAWFIHFVNDIPVFVFLAMGSIVDPGQRG